MDQVQDKITQIFARREITDASISTLPEIIDELIAFAHAQYAAGRSDGTDVILDELSETKAGRRVLEDMIKNED